MEINKQGKYENSEKGILGNGADSILGAMFWSTDYVGERNRQLLQLLNYKNLRECETTIIFQEMVYAEIILLCVSIMFFTAVTKEKE